MHYISEGSVSHINVVWPSFLTQIAITVQFLSSPAPSPDELQHQLQFEVYGGEHVGPLPVEEAEEEEEQPVVQVLPVLLDVAAQRVQEHPVHLGEVGGATLKSVKDTLNRKMSTSLWERIYAN